MKRIYGASLAVPQYSLHATGVVLENTQSGLNWIADQVGGLKEAAYDGADFFKAIREDIAAEMHIYEVAAMRSLEGVDITKDGTLSKDAWTKVKNAQQLHDQNIQLKTALAQRTQEIEKLLKTPMKSKATQDALDKLEAERLDELKDTRLVEMRKITGLKDLRIKSVKTGVLGKPSAPVSDPPEQSTGTASLVI